MVALVFLLQEMVYPGFSSQSPLLIISLTLLKGSNNPFQTLAVMLYPPSPIIPYFTGGDN
jgi:hypothetical protein